MINFIKRLFKSKPKTHHLVIKQIPITSLNVGDILWNGMVVESVIQYTDQTIYTTARWRGGRLVSNNKTIKIRVWEKINND